MLMKMGWSAGEGLGKAGTGLREAVRRKKSNQRSFSYRKRFGKESLACGER